MFFYLFSTMSVKIINRTFVFQKYKENSFQLLGSQQKVANIVIH